MAVRFAAVCPVAVLAWFSAIMSVCPGCSTQGRFSSLGPTFPAKADNFDVAVFETGAPARKYEKVARLDVHLEKTHFVGSSLEDALPELKRQARLSGSDAVIDISEGKSSVLETRIYHVTATGIRYVD